MSASTTWVDGQLLAVSLLALPGSYVVIAYVNARRMYPQLSHAQTLALVWRDALQVLAAILVALTQLGARR